MSKRFLRVTEGFSKVFPTDNDWNKIKKQYSYVGRASVKLFKDLLIEKENGISGAVQIFGSGIGFALEETEDSVNAIEGLRSILLEAESKCVNKIEQEFLKKWADPKGRLLGRAWEAAQKSFRIEAEERVLLNNLAEQLYRYLTQKEM